MAGPLGGGARLLDAEPHRPARRGPAWHRRPADAVRARHVPVPERQGTARRAPARLHRHRRVRALPAHERLQRAARDGLRRVRAARRAVRGADRAAPARHDRAEHRDDEARSCARSASATIRGAARPRPTCRTTAGRSGSSCRSTTPGTTTTPIGPGPIAELVEEFRSGARADARRHPVRRPRARSSSAQLIDSLPARVRRRGDRSTGARGWARCSPTKRSPPTVGASAATSRCTGGRSSSGCCASPRTPTGCSPISTVLDWPESIKLMQRNWIGRSTGANVRFPVEGREDVDRRGVHDAPRHVLRRHVHGARARASARRRDHRQRVAGRRRVRRLGEQPDRRLEGRVRDDRHAGRRGASLPRVRRGEERPRAPGRHAATRPACSPAASSINPVERRAHPGLHRRLRADGLRHRRDHGGARPGRARLGVRARRTTCRSSAPCSRPTTSRARRTSATDRRSTASFLDGLPVAEAKARDHRVARGERAGARARVTYKLRDWLFSRQRYWGEPFPIVYDDVRPGRACPTTMLPVELPEITRLRADDLRRSRRAARAAARARVGLGRGRARPRTDRRGRATAAAAQVYLRETNTMPQWAGSCWYYLRYLDPTNEDAMVDPAVERAWAAGGTRRRRLAEGRPRRRLRRRRRARGAAPACTRASGTRCCTTSAYVSTPEPFQRLVNQGYILAAGVHGRARHRTSRRRRSNERDGEYFHDGDAGHARVREDGQEPEERGRARRHLSRLRRRHAAAVRDVHGPARSVAPVEHRRHHRRAPLPATAVAQRRRRGDGRRARRRRTRRRRDAPAAAPRRSQPCATTWRR